MIPATRPDIDSFLRANRMHPSQVDMRACTDSFLAEMDRGLRGEPSSLAMIPTYIETSTAVPAGRKVIALDAGGTNLRAAVVSFDKEGQALVERMTKHRMPGTENEMGRDEFFRALAAIVSPLADASDRIGFCFSYPAEILPSRDGRLIHFTKEIRARGVDGELIGAGLARALVAAGARQPARIILLNDTVAALVAGRRAVPGRRFDGFIGFVCGTGVNTSYVESNAAIIKTPGLAPAGSQAINLEAGAFGRAPMGTLDDEFDAGTDNPGTYRYEKMVSGGYLGGLCLADAARRLQGRVLLTRGVQGAGRRGLPFHQAGERLPSLPRRGSQPAGLPPARGREGRLRAPGPAGGALRRALGREPGLGSPEKRPRPGSPLPGAHHRRRHHLLADEGLQAARGGPHAGFPAGRKPEALRDRIRGGRAAAGRGHRGPHELRPAPYVAAAASRRAAFLAHFSLGV